MIYYNSFTYCSIWIVEKKEMSLLGVLEYCWIWIILAAGPSWAASWLLLYPPLSGRYVCPCRRVVVDHPLPGEEGDGSPLGI
jgi:hypothetical protein